MAVTFSEIERALAPTGLIVRGGFHPVPGDGVPRLPDGRSVATLVVVGNAGAAMWRSFTEARESWSRTDPLDAWVRKVLGVVAQDLGAHAVYPSDGPPWLPFQRWGQRAESVVPSPIGPLIHPLFGLWHAYRGALGFADRVGVPPREAVASPCESCAEKPCLDTCPVSALRPGAYDVPACVGHIESAAGRDCGALGCRARRACPVGPEYRYAAEQAAFHMAAFVRANRRAGA